MCGIAGFVTTTASPAAETILRRMTDAISHRGPDADGYLHDGFAHLGHRRLSIVDLAAGQQPMCNENGTGWIVYNGEIFNHATIRPELERAGHVYKTRCDTETILHAYEEMGPACLSRFRGMFAFAIWDSLKRQLFLARDRLGIKPLYYYWDGRLFAFASEIKALLEHPGISAELEQELLPEYLAFGYISEERTLFRHIRKLMPGHHALLDCSPDFPALRIEPYWDVPAEPAHPDRPASEWIAETRRRLEETVQMRLMSDVPLGMFLSGGIDSSVIAALIRRQTQGPVETFAVGYAEQEYSELGYASHVARAIGTSHHEVVIGMDDFFSALPRLIWHEDEPIAWPSSVSLHFVSMLAAKQVKVVLTGEGSDELFGGYERYRWNTLNVKGARLYNGLPSAPRQWLSRQLATSSLLSGGVRRKLRHTFLGRDSSVESLFLDNFYCAFSMDGQQRLLDAAPDRIYGNYLRYWNSRPVSSLLGRMLYADQKTYLVELLMKQDQMSMSASIESRVPFLDHTFVEFAMSIPDNLKLHGSTQKYILKKASEDLLPHDIVYRKKMGFPTPLRQWLRQDRAKPIFSSLLDRKGFLGSVIDLDEAGRLIERHCAGLEDATDRIWRLVNLQIWGDVFFTGQRDRALMGARAAL